MISHCGISEFDLNMNNNCTTRVQTFTSKKHILGRKKYRCHALQLPKQLSKFYKFVMFLFRSKHSLNIGTLLSKFGSVVFILYAAHYGYLINIGTKNLDTGTLKHDN